MDPIALLSSGLGSEWLPSLYLSKVHSQRTRRIVLDIPERENSPAIQYTLLGIELRVGKRRISCPDLAAARYLRVFVRIGVREFAVPYNITKVSVIADELETAWQRLILMIDEASVSLAPAAMKRFRGRVLKHLRSEFYAIGAGEEVPQFDTKASDRYAGRP